MLALKCFCYFGKNHPDPVTKRDIECINISNKETVSTRFNFEITNSFLFEEFKGMIWWEPKYMLGHENDQITTCPAYHSIW